MVLQETTRHSWGEAQVMKTEEDSIIINSITKGPEEEFVQEGGTQFQASLY